MRNGRVPTAPSVADQPRDRRDRRIHLTWNGNISNRHQHWFGRRWCDRFGSLSHPSSQRHLDPGRSSSSARHAFTERQHHIQRDIQRNACTEHDVWRLNFRRPAGNVRRSLHDIRRIVHDGFIANNDLDQFPAVPSEEFPMHGRLGLSRFALLFIASIAIGTIGAGCSGGSATPSGAARIVAGTCIPVALPPPVATLISPIPSASDVSTSVGAVQFSIFTSDGSGANDATVTAVALVPSPSGASIPATQVTAQGTPSPSGSTVFNATFSATLAPNTTYNVSISGVQPISCNNPYTSSAGTFTTGS
jgi:hypothetical protein